jgi:hypothetical protein
MVHDLRPEVGALFSTYSTREVRASRIFAMSRQLLREIDEVGISLGRAVTIVPGWAPDPANPPDRKTGEKLRFVAVGTVSEEKGTEIIIDALSCADSSIVRNVSVDFFGGGDIARFQSKAGSLGLAGSVCFRGQQSHEQVMKELATYDGLLFPTWKREPFGFAALEAAVNGVTPVITKGIGASEVLTDGLHSIQIGRSAAELAKVIESAYRDRDGFRAIGERAASHVRSNFLLPYLARQVEQELLSVADNTEISRELAHKFLNINRFKYRCAQRYVTAFAPAQMGMSDIDLAASYRRLKETGRVASRGIIMKLLRSGAMKLMRPYLLDLLGREREVNERLNLLNYKIDSIASRIEKLAERDTVEPLRSDLDDPIQR